MTAEWTTQRHHVVGGEAMRRVGYILLLWGQIETKLAWGIAELAPAAAGDVPRKHLAVPALLSKWRHLHRTACCGDEAHMAAIDDLDRRLRSAFDTRNVICHGLSGIITGPPEGATIVCWERYYQSRIAGEYPGQRTYDLDDLNAELARLEQCVGDATQLMTAIDTIWRSQVS